MTGSQILAVVLIGLSLLHWWTAFLRPNWLRLVVGAGLLALLTVVIVQMVGSPLQPVLAGEGPADRLWQQVLLSLWWLLAARLVVELTKAAFLTRSFSREGRLFSDLLGGLVYLAVLLTIVSMVFALPIGGLVATSGVIAIVLGLALQNTLADVFAGIAVGIERPYGSATWSGSTGRSRARWSRSTGARSRSGPPATIWPPSPTAWSPSRASSTAACRRRAGARSSGAVRRCGTARAGDRADPAGTAALPRRCSRRRRPR